MLVRTACLEYSHTLTRKGCGDGVCDECQAFHAHILAEEDTWDELAAWAEGLHDPVEIVCEDEPHLRELVSDDPCLHLHAGDPLWYGPTDPDVVTVGEAVCYFMELRIALAWARPTFDRFLQVAIMLMGGPSRCRLPSTLYKMRTFLRVQDHMAHAVHVCPRWCRAFPREPDSSKWNADEECGMVKERDANGVPTQWCKEKRFAVVEMTKVRVLRPREWFYYFGLQDTIRRWMRDPEFCEARARRDARQQRDFWTSDVAKAINRHMNGVLLQEAPTVATPEGGDPKKAYVQNHLMVVSPGSDDAQVFNSDIK